MADNLSDVYLKIAGVIGESWDRNHLGKDGWIAIGSFNFGFSFDSGTTAAAAPAKAAAAGAKGAPAAGKGSAAKDDSNAPNKHVTFTKKPDASSTQLAQKCYDGEVVEAVTFEACRYGGSDAVAKIAFLDLTFKNVTFKKSSLQISGEGLPTESLEFAYESVTMTTIWTDNATGDRVPGGKNQAGWDFVNNKPAT